MTSSSDYLMRKKMKIYNNTCEISNNSKCKKSKAIYNNNVEILQLDPNIFNENIQYLYTIEYKDNIDNQYFNCGPNLYLYEPKGFCISDELKNNYSVQEITNYFNYISNTNTEQLRLLLTDRQRLEAIGLDLGNINNKYKNNACYKSFIETLNSIYSSMFYLYDIFIQTNNLTMNYNNYRIDSETLRDPVKLEAWINEMKSRYIADISVKSEKLNIKPEYLEYINLYGLPDKARFDPVLLNEIREKLALL